MWECKLAILATAGHPDPLLIQSIWTNIIERNTTLNLYFKKNFARYSDTGFYKFEKKTLFSVSL